MEVGVAEGTALVDVLLQNKLISSKGEWRRLVEQGGATNMDTKEKVSDADLKIESSATYKIGKRRFIKVTV